MNTAAAKEISVAQTLVEITEALIQDTHPGPDGCCNADRIAFIMDVLGHEEIDLNQTYNYALVQKSKDPNVVEASKHIAMLQLDYLKRAYDHDHVDDETYKLRSAGLFLDVRKMDWHYDHLIKGMPTPPFIFIH